ncbi:MAG: Rne/Rng family ribonuclease [Desulfuromonadaceae bacterium]|nr:Rne/Rng family ribonuclease [Desulfuromonas sp.]MDY0185551.1 Rne/Rng family ribonuclease [Desulfuromonadaceae bacterium]
MARKLVINKTAHETRVALQENGHISELYIERSCDLGIVGNIYKGRVIRVLPGMQAAFVDIGLDKAAFLYVADVFDEMEAVVDYIDGRSDTSEPDSTETENGETEVEQPLPPIETLLDEGQDILVQVAKEPLGTKGARISSHISLPGRHLVYMPTIDHIGISRRIENPEEKERLREIVERIRPPHSGFIVRTAAEGKSEEELRADMNYLAELWCDIDQHQSSMSVPALVHSDLDVTSKVLRDILTEDIKDIVVDSQEEHDKILKFLSTYMPNLQCNIQLYTDDIPLFDMCGLEIEIARALERKVWLKSGGYIIIEQTEALTAIDVNTGRYVGKRNQEDTILKTNLEAVKEIAYQVRLRNIGGLIIIDFIDMEKELHRDQVHGSLEEALKGDKNKTNILKISELGLVEMTRKRVRESIGRTLCEPCPYCDGTGYIKSRTTMAFEIFRKLQREARNLPGYRINLQVHPDVATLLYDEERCIIDEIELQFQKQITVISRPNFHMEQYVIGDG